LIRPMVDMPLLFRCAFTRDTKAAITVTEADVPSKYSTSPSRTILYLLASSETSG